MNAEEARRRVRRGVGLSIVVGSFTGGCCGSGVDMISMT